MAGIYIHIPFCKQACHYCNFHFSTSLRLKEEMLAAIATELYTRRDALKHETIETIYFGGGTPSLLSTQELEDLIGQIYKHYSVHEDPEITIEANPDDLTFQRIRSLADSPVNRLSIGTQSFHDSDLKFMNRAHNAAEAFESITIARDRGFTNITIDLIYGTPTLSNALWQDNLDKVIDLGVPHVSAYALTVEPGTALDAFIRKEKVEPLSEQHAEAQFNMLMEWADRQGFDHYEISNFCKTGFQSRHNSSYWRGKSYLGVGPSAHSFDGSTRSWNIAHNPKYIAAINTQNSPIDGSEVLSLTDRYNETVMTGFRLMEGIQHLTVEAYGAEYWQHFQHQVQQHIENGLVMTNSKSTLLTRNGKAFADRIASDCFYIEDN